MRIALNGWFLVHHPHTGSGQYLHALLEWLPRAAPHHDYHVVVPIDGDKPLSALEAACAGGFQLHPVRAGRSGLAKVIFEQVGFPNACRALRAQVAHVPYWAPPLRSPAPIVVTIHDLIPRLLPEYRGSAAVQLYTALVSAATAGASLVLTDSDASAHDLAKHLKVLPAKIRTVYLAAAPEYSPAGDWRVDDPIREKYGLAEGYVLYLGGFDPRKNVRGLLSAWTWAAGAIGQGYPLVIGGQLPAPGGAHYDDYPALAAEMDVADTVKFIGPVAEADKPALYRGASAFAYPSRYEGFGLPPLEAMASGVPVVTTTGGSLPEVVGSAGYLVPPDDTRTFGAALITIVVEPSVHADLRARGLAQARKFSWEKTARETAAAYAAVAG
ncbi:MAG: glycosyltransferase family 4 protein [Anaerolineales bacterium]|nr:glycosyltransferase family 4 protein [Anaerolineales bacterium]